MTRRTATTAAIILSLAAGAPAASARPAGYLPPDPPVARQRLQPSRQDSDSCHGAVRWRRHKDNRSAGGGSRAGPAERL